MRERNWGRWGDRDERGAANLLDADAVLAACRAPADGRVYSLAIPIKPGAPTAAGRLPPQHFMAVDGADFAAVGQTDAGSSDDCIMLGTHATTHVDALSHLWYGGRLYNGFPYTEVRSTGAARCGIEKLEWLIARAHLLDFSERPTERDGAIGAADIAARVAELGLEVGAGDALLFRTGWIERVLAGESADRCPVVAPDAAEWIAAHDIVAVAADNEAVERVAAADEYPPLHRALIRDLGVYMMELLDLSAPAADGVTTGMLVVAPLSISRGVGSPVNPLLVS